MEIFINQGKDSTIEPSYLSKTFSDKSGGPILITKNIIANGTYNSSSDEVNGYSSVTVDVPITAISGVSETKTIDVSGLDPTLTYYLVSRVVEGAYVVEVVATPDSSDTTLTTITITV